MARTSVTERAINYLLEDVMPLDKRLIRIYETGMNTDGSPATFEQQLIAQELYAKASMNKEARIVR